MNHSDSSLPASFLEELRNWTQKLRAGELSARLSLPHDEALKELVQDINFVGEMLQSLSRDAEEQLQRHTEHIAQKTRSLSTLYDVATNINMSRDLNDLLNRFLHALTELVSARAAAVYLLKEQGQYARLGVIGLSEKYLKDEPFITNTINLFKQVTAEQIKTQLTRCEAIITRSYFENDKLDLLVVPLQYRGNVLGVYHLFITTEKYINNEENEELLTNIGRHLGIAIEKANLDEEAKNYSIMQERANIANELHDSLAQTLASVKYQVRVLDETLHQGNEAAVWQELERVEHTIDEAHTELRELIGHFRAPITQRNLSASVEDVIHRFKRNNDDIKVYFQNEWPARELPAHIEFQVLRIVQEALMNASKHSNAKTVRVLMRGDEKGHYVVVIEDDGVGFNLKKRAKTAGEHIGLSVMEDRAQRVGGALTVDSEPGEGTQVLLEFSCPVETS